MKNIQIRNVPEKTHSTLRRRAKASGMSLQEYLLSMVNEAASKPTLEELFRRIESRRGVRLSSEAIVTTIRKDRDTR